MGLLDGLEKLINEHGSAAILKERIELANDKYAALERRLAEMSEDNKRLRAENEELRTRATGTKAAGPAVEIDETAQRIILLLAKQTDLQQSQIARQLGIGEELAAFYLEELENADILYGSHSTMRPVEYSLSQEGRRYLIKNGLLK